MKPTKLAEQYFYQAQGNFTRGLVAEQTASADTALLAGLTNAMEGLVALSTGLRATYILLEEVKGLLQRQAANR